MGLEGAKMNIHEIAEIVIYSLIGISIVSGTISLIIGLKTGFNYQKWTEKIAVWVYMTSLILYAIGIVIYVLSLEV